MHVLSNNSYVEKGILSLSCSSYSYPPPVLHWEKENSVLVSINRFSITTTSFSYVENTNIVNSTLQVSNLLPNDGGRYLCVASNEKATKRASVDIDVRCKWGLVTCERFVGSA